MSDNSRNVVGVNADCGGWQKSAKYYRMEQRDCIGGMTVREENQGLVVSHSLEDCSGSRTA